MALTLQPTLAEMTGDVLSAVGEGGTGVASAATEAMVQYFIKRAQVQIQDKYPWTVAYNSLVVNLPAGDTSIEWPDDSEPGNIHTISAQRADSPQFIWDLEAGITTDDRSIWLNAAQQNAFSYAPSRYAYLNGVIELGPACTQDITLTIYYEFGPAVMVSPGDRPRCDGLSVVMQAEILFRNHRGGDFRNALPKLEADFRERIATIRSKQMTPETFVLGDKWDVLDPARRRSNERTRQRPWWLRDVRP